MSRPLSKKELEQYDKKEFTPLQNVIAITAYIIATAIALGLGVAFIALLWKAIRWGFGF